LFSYVLLPKTPKPLQLNTLINKMKLVFFLSAALAI